MTRASPRRLALAALILAALAGCQNTRYGIGADLGSSGARITTGAYGSHGNVSWGISV